MENEELNNMPKRENRLLAEGLMDVLKNKNTVPMIADIIVATHTTKNLSKKEKKIYGNNLLKKWTEIWSKDRIDKIYEKYSKLNSAKEKKDFLQDERKAILKELLEKIEEEQFEYDITNETEIKILKIIDKRLKPLLEPLEELVKIDSEPEPVKMEVPKENYKPLLLKEIAAKLRYTPKTMSRKIKKLKSENKFKKTGIGKYYSTNDLQLLEKLLGCSLSIK